MAKRMTAEGRGDFLNALEFWMDGKVGRKFTHGVVFGDQAESAQFGMWVRDVERLASAGKMCFELPKQHTRFFEAVLIPIDECWFEA